MQASMQLSSMSSVLDFSLSLVDKGREWHQNFYCYSSPGNHRVDINLTSSIEFTATTTYYHSPGSSSPIVIIHAPELDQDYNCRPTTRSKIQEMQRIYDGLDKLIQPHDTVVDHVVEEKWCRQIDSNLHNHGQHHSQEATTYIKVNVSLA